MKTTEWLLLLSTTMTVAPLLVVSWSPLSANLQNGGRLFSAFVLRSAGRTNRDAEEFSTHQESTFLFHLYDNILDEPWSRMSNPDRFDELDIISSATSVYSSPDDVIMCKDDECEVRKFARPMD